MIEAEDYPIIVQLETLSEQLFVENPSKKSSFWDDATKYASLGKDERFVEEIAYCMVTLHRTGA